MFTGIVEDLGVVKGLIRTDAGAKLTVESKPCASDAGIGDSLSINGACLTVADIKGSIFSFDISSETLNRTNLGKLKIGEDVNIERSLRADSRLSGHFVTGHIDCTGKIISKECQGKYFKIEIRMPKPAIDYLVEKGSIAVDGISLTINTIGDNSFSVMIIPHTLSITTLGHKKAADIVNIEVDILAKYVQKLGNKSTKQPASQPTNVTKSLLKEHGFI